MDILIKINIPIPFFKFLRVVHMELVDWLYNQSSTDQQAKSETVISLHEISKQNPIFC